MRTPRFAIAKLSAAFCVLCLGLGLIGQAQAQRQQGTYEEKRRQANDIAVSIVVSGLSCTCARFAEDIRIGAKAGSPEFVAEQSHAIAVGLIFLGEEHSAHRRIHT